MSDRVGHLDYPKCPAKHGQFPCPYCPIILTEDYTKKEKWRGHVAQDLCAYICVFEDCESSDEMFSSTYEWMLHMATFHSETEWVCHKCTKNPGRPEQEVSVVFPTPTLLREHFHASHPSLDPSEYSFLVDAGKRVSGIQKVRCPLCRPGLVTFEQDEEDDNMTPPPSAGHEIGLVQLEEDEHIATHIHEFALHSFPSPEEEVSESSPAISHSCPSTRVEITFKGSGGLEAPHNGSSSLYSLSDITSMLDDLLGEITIISNKQEHDMQRLNDIRNLFDISKVRLKDLEESADIDALALALNESRAIVSRLKEELLGQDTEESLLDQLFDALDRSNKVLQQVLEEVTIQKNDKRARYHIPFPRNHHFIGRDAIFNELDEKFFSPKQCRKAALHGMAGIGKTQVALEFAYRVKENRPEYSILWISMSTDKRTEQDYIKIAGQLGVEELSDDHGFEEPVCRHILSDKASKYLLVVDEMDDSEPSLRRNQKPGIIQRFAESENSLILLTTRDRALAADFADTIEVGQMDHEEAARFLECLLTEKQILQDSAATTELLSYLSYHPLGITHAASYLNNIRLSIQGYQKQLNDIEPYDNKLPMKCLFLFLDVEQKDYVAVDLLSFISFIEPTAIPKSILPYFEKEEQERAIETLYEHTLIIRKKNSFFNMHTLVQVAAQTWIESRGRKQQVLNDAICHVAKIFNTLDRAYSRPWSEYLPHIIRLLKHTVGYEIKERCDLILEVGEYLSRERRYKQATKCLEQLCQWRGKNLPEEDDSLLQSRSALAYAYFDSGQTEKAIEIFKHIVAVRRKVLPKGNHIRHQSEYELAIAYLTNGQIKGAIMLFEHVVAVRQITLPTENHYRLMSEQGLAKAYIASGQSQKAVEIFEHIVPVRRETLVEESEFRLVPERWLAHLYLISGRTEEAIKILEHVVAVHEKILPEEHHDRLLCKDDLARGYLISGRTEEAIKILGHIVAVHEKILPEEHHDRLLSKDHLARAYYASGWTKEAIKILEYVVAVRKKILPEDHSNRSSSEYMLAKAYHTSGRTMEAVKILENIVRLDISDEDKARSQDLLTEALTALKVGPGSAPST
ncbi:hypothetical protein F4679DRAFT_81353 [Xylaria curta]|nr:hypothetical protein F4679DRAFT_81353 [Xylaria curta]